MLLHLRALVCSYRAIITKSPPAIRAVFSALLGPRGMKHPRYKGVRSRSCYCMRKLLRAMQPDALGGYAQTIIKVLGPIVGSGDWEERDYMSIFEMIGLLASSQSTADPANGGKNNQLAVMDAILTPMMQELSRRLASAQANAVGGGGFSPAQAAWAARTLMAVSHFAKGFPNTTISEPSSASLVAVGADTEEKGRAAVAGRLLDFFNLAARTLAENASVEDIRRQVTTLAHTLLERTGTACLAPLCKILAALLGRAPSVAGSGAAQVSETMITMRLLSVGGFASGCTKLKSPVLIPFLCDAWLLILIGMVCSHNLVQLLATGQTRQKCSNCFMTLH